MAISADVAIIPGLVNAHTHLELSWMRGRCRRSDDAGWVGPADGAAPAQPAPTIRAIAAGDRRARASGTALVGDVTNTLAPLRPSLGERNVRRRLLRAARLNASPSRGASPRTRCARRSSKRADRVAGTMAPHAPYSVSPALFLRRSPRVARAGRRPFTSASRPRRWQFLRDGRAVARDCSNALALGSRVARHPAAGRRVSGSPRRPRPIACSSFTACSSTRTSSRAGRARGDDRDLPAQQRVDRRRRRRSSGSIASGVRVASAPTAWRAWRI